MKQKLAIFADFLELCRWNPIPLVKQGRFCRALAVYPRYRFLEGRTWRSLLWALWCRLTGSQIWTGVSQKQRGFVRDQARVGQLSQLCVHRVFLEWSWLRFRVISSRLVRYKEAIDLGARWMVTLRGVSNMELACICTWWVSDRDQAKCKKSHVYPHSGSKPISLDLIVNDSSFTYLCKECNIKQFISDAIEWRITSY